MKLRQLSMLVLSTSFMMSSLTPLVVTAAESYSEAKATVSFKEAGTDPTPTDPTNPKNPTPLVPDDPVNPVHPGTTGALRFDWVPVFDFGESLILGETIHPEVRDDEYAYQDSSLGKFYAAPSVQITDVRGSNDGWTALVSASSFEAYENDKLVENSGLESAAINFNSSKIGSLSGVEDRKYAPSTRAGFSLNADNQIFAAAKGGQGMGRWVVSFADEVNSEDNYPIKHTEAGTTNKAVTLTIPATAKKNKNYTYQSTITWTISNEPGNNN